MSEKLKENTLKTTIKEKEIVFNENCILGGDEDFFINRLSECFLKAKKIDIIVAFLRETGVKLLKNDLELAKNNGVKIRILTGNYLGITEPSALYLMKDILKDKCDMRFYADSKRSFHPKAYIFHYEDGGGEIFIGSSNISLSALTKGIEWNYRLKKEDNIEDFKYFCYAFEDLFLNNSIVLNENELKNYSRQWKKPKVYSVKEIEEEIEKEKVINIFSPRGAQIEALSGLSKLRDEGMDKGIVVASTGIGKTYLAAFDSLKYEKVLFVAHREEILNQAEISFKNVRENFKTGFFRGNTRDLNVDGLFASVQTLGKKEYLNEKYFSRDYFDYIVIDEFHHAVNKNYINIINYFKPKFLLGITATPERMDNKDVFQICDYNIAYEIRLTEAINKGYLCPFRYYGIYDDSVNYDNINLNRGRYNEKELEKSLMIDKRANLILKHYKKYNSKQCIGFCSSKNHAEYMAKYFNENGVKACAVYSGVGENSINRSEAIKKLVNGNIQIIFSVDMFNEGVDIKTLDMVMFLRPTESSTIFLQQLGRGLRLDKNKKYVNVLDFIGNYKKADMIPSLIGGRKKVNEKGNNPNEFEYPEDCIVDFDFELVDIYKRLLSKDIKIKDLVKEEYFRIKEELGHRPRRVEFIKEIDGEIYSKIRTNKKNNPFKNYISFLKELDEATEEENIFLNSDGYKLINYIETTLMSKTYKMPILLGIYNNGIMKGEIDENDIYVSMKEFYSKASNKIDIIDSKNNKEIEWNRDRYIKKAKEMPIKYLIKSGEEFFEYEKGVFKIKEPYKNLIKDNLFKDNFIDSIEMRVLEYYKNRGLKNIE